MPKYLLEILLSAIVSIILFGVTIYFTGNVFAGISVITAALVIINFVLNRYETRNEASVELKIIEKENTHFFLVSIANTGGKTIYLDKGGVKTKENIVVDFDEVNVEIPVKPKPKKSNSGFPFLVPELELNLRPLPAIKPFLSHVVNPGSAQGTRKEVWKVIWHLIDRKSPSCEILELKGFFTDQLNQQYESGWMQFDSKSLVDLAKKDMENKQE